MYKKYKEYLYRLPSMKRLIRTKNVRINNKEDVKRNIELIKIYVRGHNLYDIFYGKYRLHNCFVKCFGFFPSLSRIIKNWSFKYNL